MHDIQKFVTHATIALTGLFAASNAYADCEVKGYQTVPPHKQDTFDFRYTFSGSPLDTAKQCLNTGADNEEVVARDVSYLHMAYTSSSRGSFSIKGYAEQPGLDLTGTDVNSVAIAIVEHESGVMDLANGNIIQLVDGTGDLEIFENWATFQAQSRFAPMFTVNPSFAPVGPQ